MKKINAFWKTILIIFTISLAGIFVHMCIRFINNRYGESWDSIEFNDDFLGQNYVDGRIRLINKKTGKATTPRVNWIAHSSSQDSTTVFSNKGRRGYINLITGKIFIPEQYDHAWIFSEGLAGVVKNGMLGFINIKGELVIPCQYPYNHSDQEIDFLFTKGLCAVPDTSGKFGLIDIKGTWKVMPEYDFIAKLVKGYFVVNKGALYGVIDSLFQSTIPVQNEQIRICNDGFLVLQNHTQKLYAFDAKTILQPCVYDEYEELFCNTQKDYGEEYHNLYIRTNYTSVRINDHWGVMNELGELLIPVEYSEISHISSHVFMCRKDDYWITVNVD